MQTVIRFVQARHAAWYRWRSQLLIILCMLGGAASAGAPPSVPGANNYRVLPLTPEPFRQSAEINASGQVAFIDTRNGAARARFYDGRRFIDLGSLGGTGLTVVAVNDRGQAVFNVNRRAGTRAVFYDGHRLLDIGTLGGSDARAAGLNALGQVAGISGSHVFRWSQPTGMADLGIPGLGNAVVLGINARGDIFGLANYAVASSSVSHGFFWRAGTGFVDVSIAGETTYPEAMNDAGTIVGYGGPGSYEVLGFRWTKSGGTETMGTMPHEFTWATNINRAGQVVGATPFFAQTEPHPFLWTPGRGLLDLGTGTAERGAGTKVNAHGIVIGYLMTFVTLAHGFIWTPETGLIEIGAESPRLLSSASDVNNVGQVVGAIGGRAFRWTRSQGIVDLNTLVPGGTGEPLLASANAISDSGAILARGASGLYLLVPCEGGRHQQGDLPPQ